MASIILVVAVGEERCEPFPLFVGKIKAVQWVASFGKPPILGVDITTIQECKSHSDHSQKRPSGQAGPLGVARGVAASGHAASDADSDKILPRVLHRFAIPHAFFVPAVKE